MSESSGVLPDGCLSDRDGNRMEIFNYYNTNTGIMDKFFSNSFRPGYVSPSVEIFEVNAEKGFAQSPDPVNTWTDGTIEDIWHDVLPQ